MPFHFADNAFMSILIGFLFGFVLESAGFGDTRRLAAQFYLSEMRVLKVMFGSIVVTMVLVFWGSRLGLIDFEQIWVPHTYLWPGVLGGFLLGVGFIVGGYCPGTSLVATSTLKVDGMFFVGGLMAGMFVFDEAANHFLLFWQTDSDYGRMTLMDWLGLPTGVVALAVGLLAVGAFWLATLSEHTFGGAGGSTEGGE